MLGADCGSLDSDSLSSRDVEVWSSLRRFAGKELIVELHKIIALANVLTTQGSMPFASCVNNFLFALKFKLKFTIADLRLRLTPTTKRLNGFFWNIAFLSHYSLLLLSYF
jgi:hypothetical protein